MSYKTEANKKDYEKLQEADSEKLITNEDFKDQRSEANVRIDDLINDAGYTFFTIKNVLIQTIILVMHGIHMTLFSSLIIPLKSSFQIPDRGIQIVSSVFFAGIGIGSLFTAILSKKWSRPLLINIFIGIVFLCTIIMAFFLNFIFFGILRFIIGVFLGLMIPLSFNIVTECLPLKNRALVLTGIWTGFSLGFVLIYLIMLLAMPQLEASGLTATILYIALIELIVFVTSVLFMDDSPRNLILRDEENKAFKIIEKII
jgi:MFS family permease